MLLDMKQIDLVARDMAASIEFYRALGVDIPETAIWRTASGIHHVDLETPGGVTLHWDSYALARHYDCGWEEPTGPGTRIILTFKVEERAAVDALHTKLVALGHACPQPPYDTFWGARYAIFADPDGNHVGVMSPSDPARRVGPPDL
jgi:uncharacterized glyoxalase superfamily protein PhnB